MRPSRETIIVALAAIVMVACCVRSEAHGLHLFHLSGAVSR